MTTITYRDGILAADRRLTDHGWIVTERDKISIKGEWALTGCGDTGALVAAARAFDPDANNFGVSVPAETTFVAVHCDRIVHFQPNGWFDAPQAEFHAWGSGWVPAKAAMLAGADAQRAVEIASLLDNDSGNGVQIVDMRALSMRVAAE